MIEKGRNDENNGRREAKGNGKFIYLKKNLPHEHLRSIETYSKCSYRVVHGSQVLS